jgi:glycosyltransferase involved in cell wall biosynthesis
MKIGILTDFVSHDPAYSLCGVVLNQLKVLSPDHEITVFVRSDPNNFVESYGNYVERIVELDPGETGSNTVKVTKASESEIAALVDQMQPELQKLDVVLTHDIIYQANAWKYHVAIQRLAKELPDLPFIHWVHSSTPWKVKEQTKQFKRELDKPIENSYLVAMHPEEVNRKGAFFGYERDRILIIPNPLDVMEDYHAYTKDILSHNFWQADCIMVYPARLDRGKQVEVVCEIAEAMIFDGWDVRVVICDFHSTGGDKVIYREKLQKQYGYFTTFVSQVSKETSYRVPHKVIMDLLDYADVFVHPSRSESDPLTVPEAMWKRNLLVLNFDLPLFRQYDGRALFGKFSSNIDVVTGDPGETNTEYANRAEYMSHLGRAIAYMIEQDMVIKNHREIRKTRTVEAVRHVSLGPAITGVIKGVKR